MHIADCFSMENRTIHYTAPDHGRKFSVLELHRMLQNKADDAADGEDFLDITSNTPSDRLTDNIITLLDGWKITPKAADYLCDGSITQEDGTYVCIKGIGALNKGTTVQIYYADTPVLAIQMTGNEIDDGVNSLFNCLIKIPKTEKVWKKIRVDAIHTTNKREYITSSSTVSPSIGTTVVALFESPRTPTFDWDIQVGDLVNTWVDKKVGQTDIPKGATCVVEQVSPLLVSAILYDDVWVCYEEGDLSLLSRCSPKSFRLQDEVEMTVKTSDNEVGDKGVITKLYSSMSEVLIDGKLLTINNHDLKLAQQTIKSEDTGRWALDDYLYAKDNEFEGVVVKTKQYENTWLYAVSKDNVIKSYYEDELSAQRWNSKPLTDEEKKDNPYLNMGIFFGFMTLSMMIGIWHRELLEYWNLLIQ